MNEITTIRATKKTADRLKSMTLGTKKDLALGKKIELLIDIYNGSRGTKIFIEDLNRAWGQLDDDQRHKYDTIRVALIKLKRSGELDTNLLRIAAERSKKVE